MRTSEKMKPQQDAAKPEAEAANPETEAAKPEAPAPKVDMAAKFKMVKAVTIPLLKIVKDVDYYLKFTGEMHIGEKIDDKKEAAILMQCTNLENGELVQIICPIVMQKELHKAYPTGDYVGKCFKIRMFRIPEKRYNLISLTEVEMV